MEEARVAGAIGSEIGHLARFLRFRAESLETWQ
jgi:hypothetical protein